MSVWMTQPWVRAITLVVASVLGAFFIQLFFRGVVLSLVKRTKTLLDDRIAAAFQRPIFWSTIFIGLAWATRTAPLSAHLVWIFDGVLKSLSVIIWTFTLSKVGSLTFRALAKDAHEHSVVQPQTQPLFDIFSKLAAIAIGSYAILLTWEINVGAWLASAGVVGIALGFAAKDSLSNLFAGIFIVADAPYKLGDFVVLDSDLRGSVTAIGFRSTRLLTLDDVEIIVPNSLIGNARIVNESGGPYRKARVSIVVECAYGSDVDQVKDVMLGCASGAEFVSAIPTPMVRFSSFGASGLVHELLVWIERPRYRELVVDDLNRRVYKAFHAAGIEIPFSQHDVHIKGIPHLAPLLKPQK